MRKPNEGSQSIRLAVRLRLSGSQSVSKSVSQSAIQAVSKAQAVRLPVSQSVSQSVRLPVDYCTIHPCLPVPFNREEMSGRHYNTLDTHLPLPLNLPHLLPSPQYLPLFLPLTHLSQCHFLLIRVVIHHLEERLAVFHYQAEKVIIAELFTHKFSDIMD